MNISIAKVENLKDGSRCRVTLNGIPTAPVYFLIGQTPDANKAVALDSDYTTVAHPYYTLTLPAPTHWYIWAVEGAESVKRPGALWIGLSDRQEIDELGTALSDIIRSNFPLLDAALQQRGVPLTMKQAVYGYGGIGNDFPLALVTRPSYSRESFFAPQGWLIKCSFTIMAFLLHTETSTEMPAGGTLTNAMSKILSTPDYQDIVLPSGVTVTGNGIGSASVEESEFDTAGFEVLCSLQWNGEYQIQEYTP